MARISPIQMCNFVGHSRSHFRIDSINGTRQRWRHPPHRSLAAGHHYQAWVSRPSVSCNNGYKPRPHAQIRLFALGQPHGRPRPLCRQEASTSRRHKQPVVETCCTSGSSGAVRCVPPSGHRSHWSRRMSSRASSGPETEFTATWGQFARILQNQNKIVHLLSILIFVLSDVL